MEKMQKPQYVGHRMVRNTNS